MSGLAKNIRLIRKELRCTQSVMAGILKIGFRTYVRYEAGERDAPVSVLLKLARLGNISLERLLTSEVESHDISPVPAISKGGSPPETKVVNFRKGEIEFKKAARQELMTLDPSERRMLTLFRKMDRDLQKVCLENIQETINGDGSTPSRRTLGSRTTQNGPESLSDIAQEKGPSERKKVDKKLLKEKIDRLKIITRSVSKVTIR